MKSIILLFTFILFAWSCQPVERDLGLSENYLPKAEHLKNGVVNKYYSHFDSGPNSAKQTIVFYESFQLVQPNEILVNMFNAGFEQERSRTIKFEENKMIVTGEENFYHTDTIGTEILKPVFLNWAGTGDSGFERIMTYKSGQVYLFRERQKQVRDTIILNKAGKVFEKDFTSFQMNQEDVPPNYRPRRITYLEGLGLYSIHADEPNGQYNLELVEQMSLESFRKLASHNRKRIAYIDPQKTLDNNKDFKLCGPQTDIGDYYNSFPMGEFAEGKRIMLNIISSKTDSTQLSNESGLLTFRFVVNCKGEAGWFVTEQSDLNYQEKQFNQQTIDHLYEVVQGLKTWSPSILDGEPRDAYFYLTFRIRNGKIVAILP